MKKLRRLAAVGIVLLLAAPQVFANEKAIQIAHYAVNRLIKQKLGRDARVVFEKDDDSFLSFVERKVTGFGYVYTEQAIRDFKYSVKVRPSREEFRDVEVRMRESQWQSHDDWLQADWSDDGFWGQGSSEKPYLRFKRPYQYQKFDGGTVQFRGEAPYGRVNLKVYDSFGRRVLDRNLGVSGGEWWTSARFDRGTFKAVAQLTDSRKEDVRYFTIRGEESEYTYVKIDSPSWSGLREGIIRLSGRASADSVRCRIYDDGGRKVAERQQRVRNSRWSLEQRVPRSGSYRVRVENVGERGSDEIRLRVSVPLR